MIVLELQAEGLGSGDVSTMELRMKDYTKGYKNPVGRISAGQNYRILDNY